MIVSRGFVPNLALWRGLAVPVRCHGYPRAEPPPMTSLPPVARAAEARKGHCCRATPVPAKPAAQSRPSRDGAQAGR